MAVRCLDRLDEANDAGTCTREALDQVGMDAFRPGPWPHPLDALVVDRDDRDLAGGCRRTSSHDAVIQTRFQHIGGLWRKESTHHHNECRSQPSWKPRKQHNLSS